MYSQKSDSWIENWQQATVSIGVVDTFKDLSVDKPFFKVIGTGIVFYIKIDTIPLPCLVTAKHVLYDQANNWDPKTVQIRFQWADDRPIDQYFGITMGLKENNQHLWYEHPNSNVDLACLPIISNNNPAFEETIKMMPYSVIGKDSQIYSGAQILVFGYPGVVGPEFHTKALTRSGIVAWVPPTINYETKVLIDSDIYPGNSGGPVFRLPNTMGPDGSLHLGDKLSFVGIVTQKGQSPQEVFIAQKNSRPIPIKDPSGMPLLTYESIGIGVIEPVSHVRELLSHTQKQLNEMLKQ